MLKQLIQAGFRRLGYELHRKEHLHRWSQPALARLRDLVEPATIIDVGIGAATTPELYQTFPQSDLLLVEPLKEFEGTMQQLLRQRSGAYVLTALSDRKGTAEINITERPSLSSFHERDERMHMPVIETRSVPITTLDALTAEDSLSTPFLVKVDAEGHELSVIRGAKRTLCDTACVIAEVSVARLYTDGYTFAEFIAHMDAHGFAFADLLRLRRSGPRAKFVDAVFVPDSASV